MCSTGWPPAMSESEILADYPELEREDFPAVYEHAARMDNLIGRR
jgi:uncharacterized protein (DUF433 family)